MPDLLDDSIVGLEAKSAKAKFMNPPLMMASSMNHLLTDPASWSFYSTYL